MKRLLEVEAERALGAEEEQQRARLERLLARRQELESRFLRWADVASSGDATPQQFAAFNAKLKAEQKGVGEEIAEAEAALAGGNCAEARRARAARVSGLLCDFPRAWAHLSPDEKRELLRLLLEKASIEREEGKDPVLTLKVHLLPERRVPIVQPSVFPRRKQATTGAASLTPREMALLWHVGEGKTEREAAEAMGIVRGTTRRFVQHIRQALGVYDITEAVKLPAVRLRLHREAHELPLGPTEAGPGSGNSHHRLAQGEGGSGGAYYLAPELKEVLPLLRDRASAREVAEVLGIPVAEARKRRERVLSATHSRTLFEALTKLRRDGVQF